MTNFVDRNTSETKSIIHQHHIRMKRKNIILLFTLCCTMTANAQKYLGGDVSMLPVYEKTGTVYADSAGKRVEPLALFKQQGWNTMRVRLFVDPQYASAEHQSEGVCQDLPYVIALSKQIKAAGFRLMLDIHYSDTWADPAKQFTPKRWKGCDAKSLNDSVYEYTCLVLKAMNYNHVTPDMIQVGNEISYGMLWPTGKVEFFKDGNWNVFTSFLKNGTKACREICPQAQIIIHTERAGEWNKTKYFYDQMKRYGVDYDIIGLSYYPMWHERIPVLKATLDSLQACFDKPVMIVETAFYYSHDNDIWNKDKQQFAEYYPISAEGQRRFTAELVTELNRHANVKGLFWWFPEENGNNNSAINSWINRGLFDNHNGNALPALYEMSGFLPCRDVVHRVSTCDGDFSPNVLIVYYDGKGAKESLTQAAKKYGAEIIYAYANFNAMAIRTPKGKTIDDAITYFQKTKGVTQVTRDRMCHLD
jgi:arabinogalactan endo-1,4-beta-galactosidase